MQSLEIEKAFEVYDTSAIGKTPYEKDMRECNLDIWHQLLIKFPSSRGKVFFAKHGKSISCYQDLGKAIQAELQSDKLLEANYHGFPTVEKYEEYQRQLLKETQKLIKELGDRYGEKI